MSPPIYYAVPFLPLVFFILFLAGLILLTLGLRGRPTLSSPRCAKCSYDLRTLPFLSDTPGSCPECGTPLSAPHAVSFGRYQRSPRRILAATVLLVSPLALVPILFFIRTRSVALIPPVSGPGASAAMTTPQLLAHLPSTINTPWDWQELERRHTAGTLTKSDIDQAIVALISHLNAQRAAGQPQQPLPWAGTFVESVLNSNELSPARSAELLQAFFAVQPDYALRTTIREGDPIRVGLTAQAPWDLGHHQLVLSLGPVTADGGAPLTPISPYPTQRPRTATRPATRFFSTTPDQFSGTRYINFTFTLPNSLPPGPHDLTLASDLGVLPESATLRGTDGKPGPPEKWPNPRARWQATTRRSITVVPKDQPLVQLVTDPESDPFRTCTLKVTQAAIRPASNDGLDLLLKWTATGTPATAISYKVTARAGDQTLPCGFLTFSTDHATANESTYQFRLKSLPPDVRTLDFTLTPDPASAEAYPTITRIWGQPHTVNAVPLSRFDLDPAP